MSEWSVLGALLVATLVTSDAPGADKSNAASPAEAVGRSPGAPVDVGTKTGEAWEGNRIRMEFLWCEPGRFVMGSPPDEPERADDENQVPVTLTRGFWLGKYEVTQPQWRAVMQTGPWLTQRRVRVAADSPACWLSWDDATLFCRELTRQERDAGKLPEGWEYVLPTEAQWEYACRADTTTKYSFGDDDAKLFDYAWYGEQERQPQEMNARAVGQKLPNPWGFHDLHGNVVEWCRDWYHPNYPGGTDPDVVTDHNNRVTCRGGEWRIERKWSRSACRQNLLPSGIAATVGFRVSLQQGNTLQVPPSPTVRLAVVAFESTGTTVKQQRLAPALSGLIASDLAQFVELDVLERQSAQELANEAALAETGITPDRSAAAKKAVAAYVLSGTCTVAGQKMTVTAKLERPGFAKPEAQWTLRGTVDDLFHLEEELTGKIVAALKIKTDRRTDPPPRRGVSPMLAVLPLVNHSTTARLDDMQVALAEILQANLGQIEGVRLVERRELKESFAEQKLSLSGLVDPQTALQIGKLAGAQRLLTGSFLELGKDLNIQVRIVDTGTGSVVASAKVTGPSDEFSELIDQLTQRIVAALAVPLPETTQQPPEPELYGRTLESTIHKNSGDRFRKEGNPAKAAEAYQRALLLEPHNFMYHIHLIQTQIELNDLRGAIRTGEHALLFPVEFERCAQKENLLMPLASAYFDTGRSNAIEDLLAKYGGSSETFGMDTTWTLAKARIQEKRFPAATALMEKMAEQDVAKKGVLKSDGLRRLFTFHAYHSTSVVGIPIKVHQDQARKAIQLYERVLDAAQGARDDDAATWAELLVPAAVNLITISDDNQRVLFLSPKQKADFERRELNIFGWLPTVGLDRTFDLAVTSEKEQSWDAAVDAYRRFLEMSADISYADVQPSDFAVFGDWIDKRIEAQYRIGQILAFPLNRPDEARQAFQRLVRDYGLSHFAGPDARIDMHKLRLAPEIPPDCALVWGGSTSNLNGWKIMLGAENLRLHPLRRRRLTLGDVAPYRVVIVNHSGSVPLFPSEVLALRTYVASGGSVLVIASPLWSPAGAIVKNSLLSFFEMEADAASIGNARSTVIVPHPITEDISEFSARQAVGLRVPDEFALIRSGEKTLLAARDYGRGRVVVATAGQWYTPEILLLPEIAAAPPRKVVGAGRGTGYFEFLRGSSPEPPLLRQVLRWLREPRQHDQSYTDWHEEWQAAVQTFCQAQARVVPKRQRIIAWEDLTPMFDRLVADAPNRELKEASLWTAGECLLEPAYSNFIASPAGFDAPRQHLSVPFAIRADQGYTLPCDPRFFQRLVNDYRHSPLLPFAQFRLACAYHRTDPRNGTDFGPEEFTAVAKLAKPYEKLKLKPGTYAHAWAQLQIGTLYFAVDDDERAAASFDVAVEAMPVSAEKSVALLNLAKCRVLQAENNKARRRLAELNGLPSIDCSRGNEFYLADSQWANSFFSNASGDSRLLGEVLTKDMVALETNQEFQKWRAERKQRASRKTR